MNDGCINIGHATVQVWPEGQKVSSHGHETIGFTRFGDADLYHERIRGWLLDMENDPEHSRKYFRGACGTKVHHIDQWGFPEADLLHARALACYRHVLKSDSVVADLTWASIYRKGDYCMPHSHLRSTASVLYFLDNGDEDTDDPLSGRFCFTDPRIAACCPEQEGCMTVSFVPDTPPGTMLIFPSQLVHCVNPYTGETPRITLSWNLNDQALPGEALPEHLRPAAD